MPKSIRERFSVSYERGAATSFLTLRTGLSEKIIYFQVDMIACNRIPHMLPFDVRRENEEICLRYDITSLLPLSQFLKRKISRNEFLKIFADVTKTILDSRNYFLSEKGIVLDTDYIYINPGSGEISVVYIPAEFDVDVGSEFRKLVINVIINAAEIDEGSGDNFIQRILGYAKSDTFNVFDFNKLVMELLADSTPMHGSLTGEVMQDQNLNVQRTKDIAKRDFTEGKEGSKRKKRLIIGEKAESKKFWDEILPGIDDQEDNLKSGCGDKGSSKGNLRDFKKERSKGNEKDDNNGSLKESIKNNLKDSTKDISTSDGKGSRPFGMSKKVCFAVAVQIILLAAFIASKDYLVSLNGDTSVTYAAAMLIMLAIDVLIFKRLFFKDGVIIKDRSDDVEENEEDNETVFENKNFFENYLYEDISLDAVRRNMSQYASCAGGRQWAGENGSTVLDRHNSDTVVLGVHNAKCPILKGTGSCEGEVILIVKPEFTLGRLESQVDYVIRNSAVGKVHAQIITKENSYFIKDLNSKNGTCINGVKIDSNEEYKIENNDRITLANNEYIFITP